MNGPRMPAHRIRLGGKGVDSLDETKLSPISGSIVIFILGCVLGVGIGLYIGLSLTQHHYTERFIEKQAPVIQEAFKHAANTEIAYIPKAVIHDIERDPLTGKDKVLEKREAADVDVKLEKPRVQVKVNGKPYEFTLLQGEKQKFEYGKVSLQQESSIGVELAIKPQVIDNTKTGGIDIFVGRYAGLGIRHKRVGIDIGTNGREADVRLRWQAIQW